MLEILLIFITMLITTLICVSCFYFGAKIGQKITNNHELKLPNINPVNIVKEHIEKREEKKEINKLQVMSDNIDNYDGTGLGQKDIPR